jgi:NADH:ubiquinone oxidoreductase subunit K
MLGKFSTVLLNALSMPLVFFSSPTSMPVTPKFGLLIMCVKVLACSVLVSLVFLLCHYLIDLIPLKFIFNP